MGEGVVQMDSRCTGEPGTFCFTSTEARLLMGLGGRSGGGAIEGRLGRGYCLKKTGETADRRQNNGSVKVVSLRHCAATSAVQSCNVCCTAVEEQPESPAFAAQLHLPAHDITWNPLPEESGQAVLE